MCFGDRDGIRTRSLRTDNALLSQTSSTAISGVPWWNQTTLTGFAVQRLSHSANGTLYLVDKGGFEPPTPVVSAQCSRPD